MRVIYYYSGATISTVARVAGCLFLLFLTPVFAGDYPASDTVAAVHLGVASCAGSNCHGAASPLTGSPVLQNEYLTWQRQDAHARAFAMLLTPRSLAIAQRLGISDPAKADTCLNCHADNVPVAQRGPRFVLEDGVGCEACHGGAERWITDHAMAHRTHAVNLKQGMYPTEEPAARTRLCLDCHYGEPGRTMTHAIMAAGHPPLLFEVATFTAIEPAHYRVGESYRRRKHYVGPAATWAIGQAVESKRILETLVARWQERPGGFPDFYLYDCYACHQLVRPGSDLAIQTDMLSPGQMRLNDLPLQMLETILESAAPVLAARWKPGLQILHRGNIISIAGLEQLEVVATEAVSALSQKELRSDVQQQIVRKLAKRGARAAYGDRSLAEQTVMALTVFYKDAESRNEESAYNRAYEQGLEEAYASLNNISQFDVLAYRQAMNVILESNSK